MFSLILSQIEEFLHSIHNWVETRPINHKIHGTITILLFNEGRVLLLKRNVEPFRNTWELPGGSIQIEEADLLLTGEARPEQVETAARQLRRSTGLINVGLQLLTTHISNLYENGFHVAHFFVAHLPREEINHFHMNLWGRIRDDDSVSDYGWYALDKLPDMALNHREIIRNNRDKILELAC